MFVREQETEREQERERAREQDESESERARELESERARAREREEGREGGRERARLVQSVLCASVHGVVRTSEFVLVSVYVRMYVFI
jgi:hypothetical protein